MATFVEIGLWNAAAAAVLALLAAAASRVCRRPALAHALWLLVLLKLLTPPLVPFSLSWPAAGRADPTAVADRPATAADPVAVADDDPAPAEVDEAVALFPEPAPAAPAPPVPWQWWVGSAWLTGSALWAAWVVLHVARFRRAVRHARLAPGWLQEEAEELARRLGLRRCPDVWLVPGAVSPMVWALGRRPRLLFPSGLLGRLGADGRAALLAHELAHVRRRDHWVRLVELAATGLYWWLPVLWWARRELHEAEEQCCDAWGVWALGGEGKSYALALLQAVSFVSGSRLPLPAGASGGVGQLSHLKRRLEMVMQGKTSRSLSRAGLAGALGLGLLLPLCPALGQTREQPAAVEPPPAAAAQDRNKQIDELKRALRMLEDQQARDKSLNDNRDARTMRGREVSPDGLEAQLKETEQVLAGKEREVAELKAKAAKLRAALKDQEFRKTTGGGAYNRTAPAGPAAKTPEGRVDELEKKFDMLQRQMEQLQDLLKRRPGATDVRPPTAAGLTAPVPENRRPTPPAVAPPHPDNVPTPPDLAPPPSATRPPDLAPTPPAPPADPARR